ncbi:uncharacterized protein PSFLO_05221 [Pseudozyma flocculosa]|uniref:Uncharacterized protein n=1 Tax=Pseudozyma flocculosa TaxID=84751 RepID=A0A5C3F6G5_9BASI|nr:uncharacterized protein PSFLO_05221 [Pseudozyma flocculosa]
MCLPGLGASPLQSKAWSTCDYNRGHGRLQPVRRLHPLITPHHQHVHANHCRHSHPATGCSTTWSILPAVTSIMSQVACPVCQFAIARSNITAHIRRQHAGVPVSPEAAAARGLVACGCGQVVLSAAALKLRG